MIVLSTCSAMDMRLCRRLVVIVSETMGGLGGITKSE
jgi:hypothetical protein